MPPALQLSNFLNHLTVTDQIGLHLKAREPVRLMLFMDWEDQFPHELSLTDIPALGSYKGLFPESRSSIPESRS